MKRTKRSIFILFTLFAALSLVLAACGDEEEDDADGDAPVATSTTAAAGDDADDAEPTEEEEDADDAGATEEDDDADDAEATEGDDAGDDAAAGDAEAGQAIYQEMCAACHSIDGSAMTGPTWQGLWMSEVTLEDGSTVTADEAYITESIEDPGAKVHEGFSPIMPELGLDDEQIANVIAYIKTLE